MRTRYLLVLSCLMVVGVFRPVLSEGIRENWFGWIWGLALVAALVGFFGLKGRERVLMGILPFVLALMYVQPQRVASDGIFYFAPLHSLIVDGNLDFDNEYRVLGALPGYFEPTRTGRLPNNFSIGPALLWTPFYLVAHAGGLLGLYRPTGFGYPYFTSIATGTLLAGFFGVICVFRWIRSYFEPNLSLLTAILVWLGTSHIWYMVFEPSMSHAMAMASVAWFLLLTRKGAASLRDFAVMGALGGLVALVRWQNVLFLPIGLLLSWSRSGRPDWRRLLVGGAAFLVVFSPQLFYWKALYGSFLLIPQGGGYIDWSDPAMGPVLFSSRHGLLAWAPVLWLAVLGFPGLLRKVPVLAVGLALSSAAAWYVNASVYDWWAGASFGSRRFDAALPGFGLAMAVSLGFIAGHIRRRPLQALGVLLTPLVLWNAMLMGVYFRGAIPPDGPASFKQAAADGMDLFYSYVGYPPSWPASLGRDLPPSAYDLSGSLAFANNVFIRMGDNDALHLGRGWSLPERGREKTSRSVRGERAEIFVALNEPAPYGVSFVGAAHGLAELWLNGEPLGRLELGATGRAEIGVPAQRILSGVNTLIFEVARPGRLTLSEIRWIRPGD